MSENPFHRSIPVAWLDVTPRQSDDKPCSIESLVMDIRICGLYAEVSEELVLSNPNDRPISETISFTMPDRAAVCGYAIDIDGAMRDAVIVLKDQGRVVFEEEQRLGADPGLVEVVKGNVHRARVYPIPANGSRKLRLDYTCPLSIVDGEGAFIDVPMPSEPVEHLSMDVSVKFLDCPSPEISGINAGFVEEGAFWKASAVREGHSADECIRIALPKLPESFSVVERDAHGKLWFSVSEKAPSRDLDKAIALPSIKSVTVFWDTSGSRARSEIAQDISLLRSYVESAGTGVSWRLITFADTLGEVREYDEAARLLDELALLRCDGGTDFSPVADFIEQGHAREDHIFLLFTDGLDTLGDGVASLSSSTRIAAFASGRERDAESLRQACGGLIFADGEYPQDFAALLGEMFSPCVLSGFTGEGVSDVLGIGSGRDGRFTVMGRMDAEEATVSLAGSDKVFRISESSAVPGSSISHAWAAARISQLSPRASENASELLELGRDFGIPSPATSLLVLESADQWLRHGIEPPESWSEMHGLWMELNRGQMKLSSDEEGERLHRRELERQWAELLEWWKTDYNSPVKAVVDGIAGVAARAGGAVGSVLSRRMQTMSGTGPMVSANMVMREEPCSEDVMCGDDALAVAIDGLAQSDEAIFCAESQVGFGMEERSGGGVPSSSQQRPSSVAVKAWTPDADYLSEMDSALPSGWEKVSEAYFGQRAAYAGAPAFFIDCAGWYLQHGNEEDGLRVLSNLAEMRIEDAALLRVMAWRLREAGKLERSLAVLRKVVVLRPEDSQSHRDMALVLSELAREAYSSGDEDLACGYAEEAGESYRKVALTPWRRRAVAAALFAVEEYNVLRAWADSVEWKHSPALPSLGEKLEGVLDCDLRITLAWDADETDVDIHVTEPNGEEAYYGNRRTALGGRVSEDITDGYGPELYEIRKAHDGIYAIRAHYFASHQQSVFGPASCTLTVYTDWGRPDQSQRITSTRLDNEKEMVDVGQVAYGWGTDKVLVDDGVSANGDESGRNTGRILRGDTVDRLVAVYGMPEEGDADIEDGVLTWSLGGGRTRVATVEGGKIVRIVETMSWGEAMVIV